MKGYINKQPKKITVIKHKGGNVYKCAHCTATFEFIPQDNQTELVYCPTCGYQNINNDTIDVFERE